MIFPYLPFNTLRLQRPKVAGLNKSTLLGKSTTGSSVRPGAFGGFFGVGTGALGSTEDAFAGALGSTEDAFAFAAARIFGVGAKR